VAIAGRAGRMRPAGRSMCACAAASAVRSCA